MTGRERDRTVGSGASCPESAERTATPQQGASEAAEVVRLGMGGLLNLGGALFGQVALFATLLILARALGATDVGVYSQAFAVRALLQLFALGGLRSALTRYTAIHLVDADYGALRGTIRMGNLFAIGSSVVIGVALYLAAPWLAREVFDEPRLVVPLKYDAIGLPAATYLVAALSATQGFRTMRPFAIVGSVLEPGLRLLLTGLFIGMGWGVTGAMLALTVAGVVAAVAAGVWLAHLVRRWPRERPRYEIREIGRYSAVSWLASVANQGLLWADTVILGIYVSSEAVGVYQVATRVVFLATLAVNPMNSSFAPRAADLFRKGDLSSLRTAYRAMSDWLVRLSVPAACMLLVFPGPILKVFGGAFGDGDAVIRILILGAMFDAATSSAGIVLNMSGHNTLNMLDNLAVLLLNVGLNVALIPSLGIRGSSAAWAIALLVVGTARVIQVRQVALGVLPFGQGSTYSLLAAAAATAAALLCAQFLSESFGWLVAAPLVLAAYLGVLLLLGLPAEDRLVMGELAARVRSRRTGAGG